MRHFDCLTKIVCSAYANNELLLRGGVSVKGFNYSSSEARIVPTACDMCFQSREINVHVKNGYEEAHPRQSIVIIN